jgi:hypothetical protein
MTTLIAQLSKVISSKAEADFLQRWGQRPPVRFIEQTVEVDNDFGKPTTWGRESLQREIEITIHKVDLACHVIDKSWTERNDTDPS